MRRSKYQIFPQLPADRQEALKASIALHGNETAAIWDQDGNLLEGWERETICEELGIVCQREVRHFDSEVEKFRFILAVNGHRRPSLSQKQKRAVIEAYLLGDVEIADNALAHALGTSKNTVLKVRRRLEEIGAVPKIDKTRGKDGKLRPVRYTKRIITNSPNEFATALQIIKNLPDRCAGKTLDMITAKRRASRNDRKEERESRIIPPLPDDAIRLYHCPFQELEKVAGIIPASTDLVLTDIPYDHSFLPQVVDLARFAERVLVPGGLLVCMCGQYWLNKVTERLDQFLTYRWMNASVWFGEGTPIRTAGWGCSHGRLVSKWKPLLVYSKGDFTKRGQWSDVYEVGGKEKFWHPWQQPLELFESLVRDFSEVGDLVIDPLGGGFTTAEACLRLDRRCVSCDSDADCVRAGLERVAACRNLLALRA